jgi:hypothetical protein
MLHRAKERGQSEPILFLLQRSPIKEEENHRNNPNKLRGRERISRGEKFPESRVRPASRSELFRVLRQSDPVDHAGGYNAWCGHLDRSSRVLVDRGRWLDWWRRIKECVWL